MPYGVGVRLPTTAMLGARARAAGVAAHEQHQRAQRERRESRRPARDSVGVSTVRPCPAALASTAAARSARPGCRSLGGNPRRDQGWRGPVPQHGPRVEIRRQQGGHEALAEALGEGEHQVDITHARKVGRGRVSVAGNLRPTDQAEIVVC